MFNKNIIVFIILFVIISCVSQARAEERSVNVIGGVGAGYYYLYPKDSQVKDFYNGGITWKGFLELQAESGLSVIGDIGYYSESNRSSLAPPQTSLRIIPVTASVAYHFFKGSAFSPFIGGGLGIYSINESDPDYNYLSATKFGKHIFAGADLYISPNTILRGEIRDSFIDQASSLLYYQANFSGLTAMLSLAVEWPLYKPAVPMTKEEQELELLKKKYEAEILQRQMYLNQMQSYYQQREWDDHLYKRWRSREALQTEIDQTKTQLEEDKAKADKLKSEIELKRQQYIQQKLNLRQEKKDPVTGKK